MAPQAPDDDVLFPVDLSFAFSPTAAPKKGKVKKERNNNPRSPRGLNNPGPGNEHASYLTLSPGVEASAIGSMLQIFKGPCVLLPFFLDLLFFFPDNSGAATNAIFSQT